MPSESPKKPTREWTDFELQSLISLLCRGIHIVGLPKTDLDVLAEATECRAPPSASKSNRINNKFQGSTKSNRAILQELAEALNNACSSVTRGGNEEEIDVKDVEEMVVFILEERKCAMAYTDRSHAQRITRSMRRVWQRKIPFTGSKAEWESGRKKKVMENSSLHSEGFFNSGGPIVDLPGAEKDTAGVHVAWDAVHGEGEDASAVDDPWANIGFGEDGVADTAVADTWGANTAAVDDGWGTGATASGGNAWGDPATNDAWAAPAGDTSTQKADNTMSGAPAADAADSWSAAFGVAPAKATNSETTATNIGQPVDNADIRILDRPVGDARAAGADTAMADAWGSADSGAGDSWGSGAADLTDAWACGATDDNDDWATGMSILRVTTPSRLLFSRKAVFTAAPTAEDEQAQESHLTDTAASAAISTPVDEDNSWERQPANESSTIIQETTAIVDHPWTTSTFTSTTSSSWVASTASDFWAVSAADRKDHPHSTSPAQAKRPRIAASDFNLAPSLVESSSTDTTSWDEQAGNMPPSTSLPTAPVTPAKAAPPVTMTPGAAEAVEGMNPERVAMLASSIAEPNFDASSAFNLASFSSNQDFGAFNSRTNSEAGGFGGGGGRPSVRGDNALPLPFNRLEMLRRKAEREKRENDARTLKDDEALSYDD